MPEPTGIASERPTEGRERVIYAESTDYVYVYDHVNDWWEAWERADDDRDGVGYDTEELPDDAARLYADSHRARVEHLEGELSAAVAQRDKNAEELRAALAQRDDAQRAGLKIVEQRDEARAKLDEIRELLVNHAAHAQPYAALLAIDEATR